MGCFDRADQAASTEEPWQFGQSGTQSWVCDAEGPGRLLRLSGASLLKGRLDAESAPTLRGSTPGDDWGSSMALLGDMDSDGLPELALAGRPGWSVVSAAFFGGTVDQATIAGGASEGLFVRVAPVGDVDGDASTDLAVTWPDRLLLFASSDLGGEPVLERDGLYRALGPAGDLDGDGRGDLRVEAQDRLELWLAASIAAGGARPDAVITESPGLRIHLGEQPLGDIDGDGADELLVDHFVFGGVDLAGGSVLGVDEARSRPLDEDSHLRLLPALDVSGDGIAEVYHLSPDAQQIRVDLFDGAAPAGSWEPERLGSSQARLPLAIARLGGLPDVDGDGIGELYAVLERPLPASACVPAAVWFWSGAKVADGTWQLGAPDGHIELASPGAQVTSARDIDGDGVPDVVIAEISTPTG